MVRAPTDGGNDRPRLPRLHSPRLQAAARALGIAEPTARRWWAYARAWLIKEMRAAGR
jgi:branched-subunit amino acid aminotransferase/4-amino-4-deoxychorismate lyase